MDKCILREWHIVGSILFHHLATGFILALPSVMIPAMTGDQNLTETHIIISKDQASWFITSYGLTGPIGFLILPAIMQMYGRRITHFLINGILALGSIIIACANNIIVITIGRAIHGLAFPGVIICCVIIAEYCHPKRRGFYLVFKLSVTCIGELLCHTLGLILTWRQMTWCSVLVPVLGMAATFTWPESPAWLAFMGRYDECAKSFDYVRGKSVEAKNELKELLTSQQELRRISDDYGVSLKPLLKAFRSKEFLNPLLTGGLLVVLIQASGHYFLAPYLIEIMKKLTESTAKAYYYSIGSDNVQISAILLTSYIIIIFKRRTILFLFGSLAILVLGLTCVSNYLEVINILSVKWLTPLLLIVYIFLSKISFLSVSVVSKGEIFPLQYRGLGVCITGSIMAVTASIAFKITGIMIHSIGVHGMLAAYLVVCVVLLIFLYFVMPETKDRTLQNIENGFFKLSLKGCDVEDEIADIVSEQTVPLRHTIKN